MQRHIVLNDLQSGAPSLKKSEIFNQSRIENNQCHTLYYGYLLFIARQYPETNPTMSWVREERHVVGQAFTGYIHHGPRQKNITIQSEVRKLQSSVIVLGV